MTVAKNANIDSLDGLDSELRYIWGPWVRRNGHSYDDNLGYPRVNVLHINKGLGGGGSYCDKDLVEIDRIDALVRNLPNEVMRKVAREWWGYNACLSKQALCREMVEWYRRRGVARKVYQKDVDLWISGVVLAVWVGLGSRAIE